MKENKTPTKPSLPAPLPYKGAPLGLHDLVMQQVRFEEKFLPHLEYTFPEEVMRKELPSSAWKPSYGFIVQVYKFIAP